jgi:hypothetical protein
MKSKVKYIGIESRVHFEVLEAVISGCIQNGNLNKVECLNHIKQFTKGDNRAVKILKHVSVLISKNEHQLDLLRKSMKGSDFYQLNNSERRALILCLFCVSFPITYDILVALAQGFKVQDKINKQVIKQKIGSLYGGNRAMDIAITEIMPFLIDCRVIQRVKLGIYSFDSKLVIRNLFIAELIVYTDILLSGSKSILIDDINFRPWYSYFDISGAKQNKFNQFISKKDSALGNGYLNVK